MEWLSIMIAFGSGVGLTLFGAFLTMHLQGRADARRQLEARRFDIYMKLMELHGLYFWIGSAEMRGEQAPADVLDKIGHLAWKIADLLHSADPLPELPKILELLFSTKAQPASDRYKAIGEVIERLGRRVNPRYAEVVKRISDENLQRLQDSQESNAPGFLRRT